MTEKDHYKYGLSGYKVDVEVAEKLRAQIRTQRDRIRALEDALREASNDCKELGGPTAGARWDHLLPVPETSAQREVAK